MSGTAATLPPQPPKRAGLWPGSLAGRTALVLLLALTVIQAAGLTIHALDRVDLQRFSQGRRSPPGQSAPGGR
ncbi:hypothetical protein ACFQU2_17265 [Siccirubricoccus deserti]